jgi:hypothetical protein
MPDLAEMNAGDWRNNSALLAGPGWPDEATARVKRHSHSVYSLDMVPAITRNRWGNLAEITADCEHFLTYGRLPGPDGDRW